MSRSRCSHNVFEGRAASRPPGNTTACAARHAAAQQRSGGPTKSPPSSRANTASCWSPRATAASRAGASAARTDRQPPAELDFNLWLGPAPEQPYHGNLVHYNWHWFWDFGNGDIGNQGVHEMDVARWAIKGATLPTRSGAWAAVSPTRTRAKRPTRRWPSSSSATRCWSSRCAAWSRSPEGLRRSSSRSPTSITRPTA